MNQATADFIRNHAAADVRQLALQGTKIPGVDLLFALDQIAGRQTARQKLPSWAGTEGIVYPPHLSMEQCSSEQTARYKVIVAGGGQRLVDLTGGFGVDFSFMAHHFAEAVYVEREEPLCDIARENFQTLGLAQAEVVCADSVTFLQTMPPADLIYLDPARRDAHGGRTYSISDCTPDVLALLPQLLEKSHRVLLKLSPMLDWRKAVADIGWQHVREVHIVSVANECKELLLLLCHGEGLSLTCVNDDSAWRVTTDAVDPEAFASAVNPETFASDVAASTWLYEPNTAVMKSGCFGLLSRQYGVKAIAPNSHLFVASEKVEGFPGRVFQIEAVTTMNKRELKQHLQGLTQANITVRNFPLAVADLRRRLKISEGGSTYIFATTLANHSHVLLITRKPCTEPQSR